MPFFDDLKAVFAKHKVGMPPSVAQVLNTLNVPDPPVVVIVPVKVEAAVTAALVRYPGATPKRNRKQNMPLVKSKSKAAFKKNVKTEIAAGKPPKQSLAIAYSVKRKARRNAG